MITKNLMGEGKLYLAPSCEKFELLPESNMLVTASEAGTYGQAGRAGNNLNEMDELDF